MKKILTLCLVLLIACTKSNRSIQIVEGYLHAYNQHDIEAMLEYLSDDVKWMSINADQLITETSNQEELRIVLLDYFEKVPTSRSELQQVTLNGHFVNAVEKATWKSKDGEKQEQCAVSVYEIQDQLIKNIWYFNSSQCE